MAWFLQLIIGIILSVISYLLTPRPKQPKPPSVEDLAPTADAGRPIPVVFGTIRVTGVNCLWYGELNQHSFNTEAE
jgi:hypothetical protein